MNGDDGMRRATTPRDDRQNGPTGTGGDSLNDPQHVATFPPPELPEPIKTEVDRVEMPAGEPAKTSGQGPLTVVDETAQAAQDRIDTDAR